MTSRGRGKDGAHHSQTAGIDISRDHLDACIYPSHAASRFANDANGLKALIAWLDAHPVDRIIFKPTGVYHHPERDGVHQEPRAPVAVDIAVAFLLAIIGDPAVKRLLSDEHFSVDGTLIDAWVSMKSFRRKDGGDDDPAGPGRNAERHFRGDGRSNETHASVTDPDARLYRKSSGQPSRFCYMGHLLIESRQGLIVDVRTTLATGRAERETAVTIIAAAARGRRATLGADKAYDAAEHVANLRAIGVTPHVAQNLSGRRSAIDGRTTRHRGYEISQCIRKRIEKPFGWIKTTAELRKTRHRGISRVGWIVTLTAAAANLVRLPRLLSNAA